MLIVAFFGALAPTLNMLIGRWLDWRQSRNNMEHSAPRSLELRGSVWYSITLALSIIGMQSLLGLIILRALIVEEPTSLKDIPILVTVLSIVGNCFAFFAGGFLCGKSLSDSSFFRVAVISSLAVWFFSMLPYLFLWSLDFDDPSLIVSVPTVIVLIVSSVVLAVISFGMLLLGVQLGSRRPIVQ